VRTAPPYDPAAHLEFGHLDAVDGHDRDPDAVALDQCIVTIDVHRPELGMAPELGADERLRPSTQPTPLPGVEHHLDATSTRGT
jgi:hypothetical protein